MEVFRGRSAVEQARVEGIETYRPGGHRRVAHLVARRVRVRHSQVGRRQEDDRRGGRDVEQQVVERRLICNTVAAADRRLAVAESLAEQSASELRRVDEAETRREVVVIRLDTREDALVQWDVLPPEGRRGVLLALAGKAVEQVHRLSGVFVPNTQVERKVRAD